jgi:adhesin/invasin
MKRTEANSGLFRSSVRFFSATENLPWFAMLAMVSGCTQLAPISTAKAPAVSYTLQLKSGNNQSASAGNPLPYSLVAVVTDASTGALVPNITVNWAATSGGGSIVQTFTNTGPQGENPVSLSLGPVAGTNTATATISGTTQSITFTETGTVGPAATSACNIVGSSPIEPDGVNYSTITVTLKDVYNNVVSGSTPTFSATGSTNAYGTCSVSDASGTSICTLSSTTAETKILSLLTPTNKVGGTVVFTPGPVSGAHSTISGTGSVVANGIATSTVSITLKDSLNVPVGGVTPSFTATNTGSGNTLSACSVSNASGVSTCTLASTHAETKTLSITSPVSLSGGTVVFVAGPPATAHSTITGTGPIEPDGTSTSAITITLRDANSNPIALVVPHFSATNTSGTNVYGTCSSTNASGVSTCTLSSTYAETKTLSVTSPISYSGGTVLFSPGNVVAANSTINGTGTVVANGVSTSTITIVLKDASHVAVGGVIPAFVATDTGSGNTMSVCSSTDTTGTSTCTLKSTVAETKNLSLTSPVTFSGGSVVFTPGPPSVTTTILSGTGSVVADGSSTSNITLTLYDAQSNPISGTTPSFSATDTGSTNAYGACTSTNASGVSTCSLTSTKAELKTLTLNSPVSETGGTVLFVHGPTAIAHTTITGTGPIENDGSSQSAISIDLKDAYSNPVDSITPNFSATDGGSDNVYGACSTSNASGLSTCTLSSSTAETKTLSLTSPVPMSGGTVVFSPGAPANAYSTILGTGSIVASGSTTSTISIVIKDSSNVGISNLTPTFSATNSGNGNTYGVCSLTDASGQSTCSLSSTKAEVKTLTITSPLNKAGGTVTFTAGTPVASTSQISGTGPVVADGSSTSSVTMVIYDVNSNPVSGITPSFSATDTSVGNSYGACSATSATGSSTCTLASTVAEVKTLSITSPVSESGGTVNFTGGAVSAGNSSIVGTGSVAANGTSTSTITITLKDAHNNPISGTVPAFDATDTGSHNSYGSCSSSNASGVSTCTLTSTKAETKTLLLTSPVSLSGGSVVFTQALSSGNSSLVGTGSVAADNASTSTITITLKDYSNAPMIGYTPTFTATDTGSYNVYGACGASDGTGVSTCTLKSKYAETKTLNLTYPSVMTGGTVVFTQAALAANSSITGTAPVSNQSTITIYIRDYANVGISGLTPTFSATNTLNTNVYGACSVTTSTGYSTCTLRSSYSQTKTLTCTSPITFTGGTVSF